MVHWWDEDNREHIKDNVKEGETVSSTERITHPFVCMELLYYPLNYLLANKGTNSYELSAVTY